jgi:hypothetical protein
MANEASLAGTGQSVPRAGADRARSRSGGEPRRSSATAGIAAAGEGTQANRGGDSPISHPFRWRSPVAGKDVLYGAESAAGMSRPRLRRRAHRRVAVSAFPLFM